MKKTLAFILALTMCFTFAACGKEEPEIQETPQTPVEETVPEGPVYIDEVSIGETIDLGPDIDPVIGLGAVVDPEATEGEASAAERPEGGDLYWTLDAGDTVFNVYTYYNDEAQVYACVSAVNAADESEKWNFVTEPQYVGQLDNYTIVGLTTAGFVFTKEDVVYCLNPVDGSLEWMSEPMGDWPTGYFAVDNYCNFYFPGYFIASLTVIDAGGNTVNKFEELESVYGGPIDDGWCEGIEFGSDGYLRMKYCFETPTVYVIDIDTGCAVDEYPATVSVENSMLSGLWMDNYYTGDPHVIINIDDDLGFDMSIYNPDGSLMHNYEGYFELGTFVNEVGSDWLISHLTDTDDENFAGWDSIGDYVVTYFYQDAEESGRSLELVQVNNGDSVLYDYFEMTNVILHEFEAMG